jgi:lactoylglutathione lyase
MVRVRDLEESLRFYCNGLGLKEVRRSDSQKGRFTLVFLAADEDWQGAQPTEARRGAPHVELTYNWPDEDGVSEDYGSARNFGHLAYEFDDIYAVCQRLMAMGVVINRPPRDGHMAFVRSPDGISIELLQTGEAKAPQEPWASMANVGVW